MKTVRKAYQLKPFVRDHIYGIPKDSEEPCQPLRIKNLQDLLEFIKAK